MKKTFTKSIMLLFLILFSVVNVTAASRTVVFTGPDTNYTSKENVTIVETSTSGGYVISCINASSQSYLRFNGTTEHIMFTLVSETEKIDSVRYIWRSNTTNHHFLFLYGTSLTLGTYLGSGDSWQIQNGGWSKSVELSTSGITNCPGSVMKFPEEITVKSLVMCRRIVINDTSYPENTKLETLYARMNNSVNTNYPTAYGSGSTTAIGEVILYISDIITSPTISLTSGNNPASAMETLAMTPVVYTYAAVADDANVLLDWYTDNTYTSTTSAPGGLSISKNTVAKTVTVNGTPTTVGTYYYKISIDEEGGNEVTGSIVVEAYVTPAPIITLTSGNNNQVVKAGTAIANIVYTFQHADGGAVTSLPAGLSGAYNDGTYTISGTVGELVTPGTFNYTVTADPLSGYSGGAVTATGSVVVKSSTAKDILYLTASATPSAQDTQLYPLLNNNVNYLVTVKQAAGSAPASSFYDPYDLIVLNEIVAGGNAEANALISINKPLLNFKSYQYNSGRWTWGTADNGAANNGTVTVTQPTHPIFAGITLNEGMLELLSGAATKGVQPVDVTIGGITVATAPKGNSEHAVAIHDVPANVRGESITTKYILIALCNDSYDKMTGNTLTLLNNSVDYLLTGSQFVPVSTATDNIRLNGITLEGLVIRNSNNELIRVMDMSGRIMVTSNKDIEMSTFNKGIYIIHGESGVMKIALTK
ncbi:MAG: hypothetical protein Q7J05_05795 [Paludibacter sp.]|nr:hypothetical protein [Paludibacter sp.]